MSIKVFLDTADLDAMRAYASVDGFTTNPTLMRRAGVAHYRAFAQRAVKIAAGRPVSFEVVSDAPDGMRAQALAIAALGKNAHVKIPVTDTRGASMARLIAGLAQEGVPLNVTAVFTPAQVEEVGRALAAGTAPAVVSVFAGRVADAGVEPGAHVRKCRAALRKACPRAELLWASPRQVYDYVLAEKAGADIITATPELVGKLNLIGRNLDDFSRETVQMFYDDAMKAGYSL